MKPIELTNLLESFGFEFATGVPDSVFKYWLLHLNKCKKLRHIICANEGEACAIGAGYYLGTGKAPVIYLQNSGLGNCFNPLTSLLDKYIYSIPVLLLISWRGCPGKKDEPQHKRMGKILPEVLALLDIPYEIALKNITSMENILSNANEYFKLTSSPYAILFQDDIIEPDKSLLEQKCNNVINLSREQIIEAIISSIPNDSLLITTTGKTSRELFEIRQRRQEPHYKDFLTVGSMGCSSSIALGLALAKPTKPVVIIDGDGACLMRLEAMSTIGHYKPENLLHILINNFAYESTGAQKTVAETVDFVKIAQACQYRFAAQMKGTSELSEKLTSLPSGPSLLVIDANTNSRNDLGRPSVQPIDNKNDFMKYMQLSSYVK